MLKERFKATALHSPQLSYIYVILKKVNPSFWSEVPSKLMRCFMLFCALLFSQTGLKLSCSLPFRQQRRFFNQNNGTVAICGTYMPRRQHIIIISTWPAAGRSVFLICRACHLNQMYAWREGERDLHANKRNYAIIAKIFIASSQSISASISPRFLLTDCLCINFSILLIHHALPSTCARASLLHIPSP